MKFKQINSNGLFCWSPTRAETSLAVGTTAQQFDTNFSSDNKLEIYGLNIHKPNEETSLRSSKVMSSALTCMKWHTNGLICGTQLKNLQFYKTSNDIQLKHETEVQTSTFTCLDLNPKESHTLAVGCEDGSVGVWDIETKAKFEQTLNLNSSANDSVNVVKWNRQVLTILASASNSNIHVWDIRKATNTGPIMRVHDNNAASIWGTGPQSLMISRSLVWSETTATTLIVANSNDANPILQIWDLRYATSPLNNIRGGHSRGVQSISWNRYDEHLLLSAGKDNTVCLWNPCVPTNEEPLQSVLPFITNQWINEIEWCDWEPSLFAINSFDGKTTVYNITQNNSYNQTTNQTILESFSLDSQNVIPQQIQSPVPQNQPILNRAPKWMRTPCRASFGFSGKLVTYNVVITQTQSQPSTQYTQHIMTVHQVMTDPELLNRAEKLENALSNGNFMDYCLYKICEHSDNENISKAWKLVSLHFENDRQKQKEELLQLLGFDDKISHNSIQNSCDLTNSQLTNRVMSLNINQTNEESINSYGTELFQNQNLDNNSVNTKLPESLNIETSDSSLGNQINRGILSGDLNSVVKNCIENNDWTEAILVCCFVSPEHTASTLRQYFNYCLSSKPDSWSSLLWCIITAQTLSEDDIFESKPVHVFEEFISKVELKYWRQVLVFIVRESENWEDVTAKSFLIHGLAKRLIDSYVDSGVNEWLDAGIYCYIINGDYINLSKFVPFGSHLDRIELSLILQKCSNSEFVANQLTAYFAKLLAVEGKLDLALKYIDDNEIELKDRIIGNLRPNNRRFSAQTQAVAPRVQKNIQPFNRNPNIYQNTNPIPISKPIQNIPVQQIPHSMAPNMSRTYGYPSLTPAPPTPMIPTVPIVPNIANPPQLYQMTQQNTFNSYGNQSYGEQQYSPPIVTPGWNDPPVLSPRSRHNSFSASLNEGHSHTFAQKIVNTISNPLPVIPSETVEPSRPMRPTRPQSVAPPSEPLVLSPQNQQIMDAFDRLVSYLQQSLNSQPLNIRRKLEDSRLKLETLRSKLASNSQLSSTTLLGLTQIANALNQNDFQTALECHTHLVTSTTFGETTSFLPAIKVIIHLAQQRIQT